MKEFLLGLSLIAIFAYICMLPWIAMFRILVVLAKVLRWIGIKFIDLSGYLFRGAMKANRRHRKSRRTADEEKELFGDSLEF